MSTTAQASNSPPRRLVLILTTIVAVASAIWIYASFTYPVRALVYHWPIMVLACPVTLELWWARKSTVGRAWIFMDFVAMALTAGRYFSEWPFSGHALLGAYWACAPLPRLYRWLSASMIPLSYFTKVYLDERSTDALTGLLIGLALAITARTMARNS